MLNNIICVAHILILFFFIYGYALVFSYDVLQKCYIQRIPSLILTAATDSKRKTNKKLSSSVPGDELAKFTVFSRNNMAIM
jgi:hypothetical protein